MWKYEQTQNPDQVFSEHLAHGNHEMHKYIKKIGNRYFYTQEQIRAFGSRLRGAQNQASTSLKTAKANAQTAYTNAKTNAQTTYANAKTAYANAKTNLQNLPNKLTSSYDQMKKQQEADAKKNSEESMHRLYERVKKNAERSKDSVGNVTKNSNADATATEEDKKKAAATGKEEATKFMKKTLFGSSKASSSKGNVTKEEAKNETVIKEAKMDSDKKDSKSNDTRNVTNDELQEQIKKKAGKK